MRVALVKNGIVMDVLTAVATYTPPEGYEAIESNQAGIGDTYTGGVFTPYVPPVVPPVPQTVFSPRDFIQTLFTVRADRAFHRAAYQCPGRHVHHACDRRTGGRDEPRSDRGHQRGPGGRVADGRPRQAGAGRHAGADDVSYGEQPSPMIDGDPGQPSVDKPDARALRAIATAEPSAVAPIQKGSEMRVPRLLGGRANPVETALQRVQQLEAKKRKLDGQLATAVARVEAAQATRRAALIEADSDMATMAKLDRACAEASETRVGIEGASRHIAGELDDAQAVYLAHVDTAKRAAIIAECEARAEAIDDAAERLADAARIFSDARIEMHLAYQHASVQGRR